MRSSGASAVRHGVARELRAAQDFPTHPIRLISPNPAGGANDTIARIVVNKLTEVLGVQVVIDNRGGGGGVIGGEIAAHATPDGYTLLAGSVSTHSFAPLIHPKLGYDPVHDLRRSRCSPSPRTCSS